MTSKLLIFAILLVCAGAAPANEKRQAAPDKQDVPPILPQNTDDLKTDASTAYGRRYLDSWSGYPSGGYKSQVTGYGLLDDRYSPYSSGVYNNIGYKGYDREYSGINGYSGYGGYAGNGLGGYGQSAYVGSGYNGYGGSAGYGGYGGYGGNGGISSYYGYNNPYYQGAQNLGYGYYNKKFGYGNIYNGITPNLVTGYRGYSRR